MKPQSELVRIFNLGNEIWSASWLSEMFVLGCQSSKFQESLSHLIDVLANSIFEADRILTIAKNILSELVESKRNASVIMTAVTTRMTRSDVDLAINIFTQQEFLQNLIQEIKSNPTKTIKALNEIQLFMMNGMSSMGFAQVSLPLDSPFSSSQVQKILSESWETGVESFRSRNQIRKRDRVAIQQNPFPFPRKSYSIDKIDAKFGKSVMVQVPGLQNSTLGQFIECDLLTSDIRDQVAVMVLCELLSRMEGPIFTAIRGNGLAYGCHVDAFVWSGQLHFEVSSSSEPQKALAAWYKILEDLSSAEGFSEICSDFNIETAKSMSMYSLCASKSTASGNIINVLRETLRGMSFEMENLVEGITAQDLRRVFDGYFVKFRNPEDRVTVLVTGTMGGSEVCESFKEVQVEMRMIDLDEFKKND